MHVDISDINIDNTLEFATNEIVTNEIVPNEIVPNEIVKNHMFADTLNNVDANTIDEVRNKIKNILELNDVIIPIDIKISTMTIEAKLKTKFYPWNIYRYIRRSLNAIVSVVKPKEKKNKRNTKNKNKQSDIFLNQVAVSIKVSQKKKPVSVKVFKNGSLHFTGCICVDDLLESVYKLCIECRKVRAIINKFNKITEILFASDLEELKIEKLYGFKIDMINCNFLIPFKIDRPKLQIVLNSDGYNAEYDSNGHAGVKIKYVSKTKKITIFVFESGSIIIILGNQGFGRIDEVYTFIYKYLLENYEIIVKDDYLTNSSIIKYLEKYDNNVDNNVLN